MLYFSSITRCYFYLDDITQLMQSHLGTPQAYYNAEGRPFYGWILYAWRYLPEPCDLRWIRAASLCLLGATGLLLMHITAPLFPNITSRTAIILTLCSLPALAIHVLWASMINALLAGLLALSAGIYFNKTHPRYHLAGAALLFISLALYQPASCMAIMPIFCIHLQKPLPIPSLIKRLLPFFLTTLAYVVWYRLHLTPFDIPTEASDFIRNRTQRSSLTHHPLQKLHWFISGAATNAFAGIFTLARSTIEQTAATFSVVTIGTALYRSRISLYACLSLLGLLLLSYYPSLLISENDLMYRTQTTLTLLTGILLFWGLMRLTPSHFFVPLSIGIAAISMLSGGYFYHRYFVELAHYEHATLRTLMEPIIAQNARNIAIIPPAWGRGIPRINSEFGHFSSAHDWVPYSYVHLLSFEITGEKRYFTERYVIPADFVGPRIQLKGAAILDANSALNGYIP